MGVIGYVVKLGMHSSLQILILSGVSPSNASTDTNKPVANVMASSHTGQQRISRRRLKSSGPSELS